MMDELAISLMEFLDDHIQEVLSEFQEDWYESHAVIPEGFPLTLSPKQWENEFLKWWQLKREEG